MTFSSRVICEPPPPSSRMIRCLCAALWAMPVIASAACLAATPSKTGKAIASLFQAKQQPIVLASAQINAQPRLEPELFRKVASTPRYRSLFDLYVRNKQKFPMQMAYMPAAEPAARAIAAPVQMANPSGVKSGLKVAYANTGVSRETVGSIKNRTLDIASAPLVETRVFDFARVAAANVLTADGLMIVLSGINPPKSGSKCRRIDGAMLDCSTRAEARLAVLMIDRRIKCQISAPVQPGVVAGKCQAGKIDMASDLLRQGLAHRATASNRGPVL